MFGMSNEKGDKDNDFEYELADDNRDWRYEYNIIKIDRDGVRF